MKSPALNRSMPVTFSLVLVLAAGVAADAELRQVGGADLALLEQRRHQAVGDAAVRGAFAHRVDARVGHGLQGVADDDAALAVQAGASASAVLGRMPAAITTRSAGISLPSLNARPSRGRPSPSSGDQACGLRADLGSACRVLQRLLQQLAGHVVELALHQPVARCTTVTCMPRSIRPLAASRPSRPPPITTACRYLRGRVDHGLVSAMSR
jgi:hypothetical protein